MKKKVLIIIGLFIGVNGFGQAPSWAWAKGAGGSYTDRGYFSAIDNSGNVYVTGNFDSPSITFGSITLNNLCNGDTTDMFLVKYDNNGNVLWAKSFGGILNDGANAVTTDALGNVYIGGQFESQTISFGSVVLTNTITNGYWSLFFVKLDSNGNGIWGKTCLGNAQSSAYTLTTDVMGNLLVAGGFFGSSLTLDGIMLNYSGGIQDDIFIAKYDSYGNIIWAKTAGGNTVDDPHSIATDASGNVYLVGWFASSVITFGTTILTLSTSASYYDSFIVKYDSNGNVIWAKSAGGNHNDEAYSVVTNSNGEIYVAGRFSSTNITFGTNILNNIGVVSTGDIYIVKYDTNGNVLWAQSSGGSNNDFALALTKDSNDDIYLSGAFYSTSITLGSVVLTNTTADTSDIFVAKLNPFGNVQWAISAGGINKDFVNSIVTDAFDNVFVTGFYYSPAMVLGSTTLTNSGVDDMFIAKLNSSTGISEINNQQSTINISPNPTTTQFTITFNEEIKNAEIKIINVLGEIVFQSSINNKQSSIDISALAKGIYFVEIIAKDKQVMRSKLIKE